MASSTSNMKDPVTVEEIEDIGRRLISLPSSHVEQLHLLDHVEDVLRRVEQSSPQAVIEALKPITKALVADVLLKNDVRDVKISVASCISQIMRITAPDSPYSDEELKIYFQVSVSAFEELSSLSYPRFSKIVSILESFAMLRTCVLMLDLELDTEIVKMFRNLFYTVGSRLSPDMSFYLERIMTLVIEESEELSDEIIMLLIDNLKIENRKAQPLAWELGAEILKKCGTTLKKYIPKAVESMSLDLNDFAEIVASICQDVSGKKNSEVKDITPKAADREKASGSTTVTKNSKDPNGKQDDASKGKKPSKKRKSITRNKQPSKKIDTGKENEDEQPSKRIATSKENKDEQPSKTIVTSKENEDELPIAAMKGSNSRSKRSAKGESSKKTNKKQRTESEIIATAPEPEKQKQRTESESSRKRNKKQITEFEIIATAPEPEKQKQRTESESSRKRKKKQITESEIIATNAEETKAVVDTTEAKTDKRNRKPNSLLKSDEGYWSPQKRSSKKKLDPVNVSEGHEKVTNTTSEKSRKKLRSRQHGESTKVKRKSISTELNEDEATKEACVIKVCGPKLVGRKIKVWWPEDSVFYPGKIASFDQASDKYEVLYQDGDMEMLDLKKEKWELLKDGEEVSGSAAPVETIAPESAPESKTVKADIAEVRGYMVKASTAETLESIFSKYGDIASNCPYKSASVKASLLEIICNTLQNLHNDDSPPDFNEVESVINDAEKAKLEIGWLRVELEKKRVTHEAAHKAGQKGEMLRGTKRRVLHAVKAAKFELKHRKAELAAAQRRVEEAERCFNALQCVQKKVEDDILELEESRKKRRNV